MAECQILFHLDRKKAEIYNSLHWESLKSFPHCTVPTTEIKTTDIKPIWAIRIIIPSNIAIKVVTTLTVINNEKYEPPVTPEWYGRLYATYLELAHKMLEPIYSFSPTSMVFEMNQIKGKQTPWHPIWLRAPWEQEELYPGTLLGYTVWSCMETWVCIKNALKILRVHTWLFIGIIIMTWWLVLYQPCYSEMHKTCRPWGGHIAKSSPKRKGTVDYDSY